MVCFPFGKKGENYEKQNPHPHLFTHHDLGDLILHTISSFVGWVEEGAKILVLHTIDVGSKSLRNPTTLRP
jgi:hypothetical protein